MVYVLAAIDASAATSSVLDIGWWYADLFGLDVVGLHVAEDGDVTARAFADAAGVVLFVRHGDPMSEIRDAASDTGVRAVVIGARGVPASETTGGPVTLELIRTITKPIRSALAGLHPDEVIHLRVLDADNMPWFVDHGTYDADLFAQELTRESPTPRR